MKLTPRERFLAKVCPEPKGGCWLWRGQVRADGYGLVRFERKVYLAHRLAWKFFRGEISTGLVVCHKCDVRACVNPEHLFLGTMMDNVRDMMEKGRSRLGEKNTSAKLTTEQVRKIKTILAEGLLRVSDIAREYGVAHSTIGCIARGTSWRHVKADTPQLPELDDIPADPATQEPMIADEIRIAISKTFHLEANRMADFKTAFLFTLQHEDSTRSGKVTVDAGGRTRFGIAEKFHPDLPEEFFTGPAEDALVEAEKIEEREYWDAMRLAEVEDQNVANKLFDMSVNMGVRQAAVYAQRAVNSQGQQLTEDGNIGPRTLAAINAIDPQTYYGLLCQFSAAHYRHIATNNPAQAVNLAGWLKRAEA